MAQDTNTNILGLVSQYNPLNVKQGALREANDCVIRRENIAESRRGYNTYATAASTIAQVMEYNDRVIIHQGSTLSYDNGSGTFADYTGSYSAPSGKKIRSALANGNLYFTTSTGVRALEQTASSTPRQAGVPRCLDLELTPTSSGGAWLDNNYQAAYRAIIAREDTNSNLLQGYPSTRAIAINTTGGAAYVAVKVNLHPNCVAGDIVKVYRTAKISGTTTDVSGDEMNLCYSYTVTSTDITNKYITFNDTLAEELLGETLYSSPSQEGIFQANAEPPYCTDVAFYAASYMFYAATKSKQRLYFTLTTVNNLVGKTITLAGVTYQFHATTEDHTVPQVKVESASVTALNISQTARSLVRVINKHSGNTTVVAYYLSGPDDLPGKILIEERGFGASAFTLNGSDSSIVTSFFPQPPVSPSTNAISTSSQDDLPNRIYYSKLQQPDHVPELNYFDVGPKNSDILRIVALRDSLIIITENGVYRLTGTNPSSFDITPLDLTVKCKAQNTVALLANQAYMLSDQGIVAISDQGVSVVSRDIEQAIIPLIPLSGTSSYSYAVPYESERSLIVSVPTSSTDTETTQSYVYNVFTKAWTRWTFGVSAGIVLGSTDKMYFAKNSVTLYSERKSLDATDFTDADTTITIDSIGATSVTITSSVQPVEGDSISKSGTTLHISSVTQFGSQWICELVSAPPALWTTGSATLYQAVGFSIKWFPWHGTQPGLLKQLQEIKILSDPLGTNNTVQTVSQTVSTDLNSETTSIEINTNATRWGSSAWGSSTWGGQSEVYSYVAWPPQDQAYCRFLTLGVTHSRAREKISVAGYSIKFKLISEKVSR